MAENLGVLQTVEYEEANRKLMEIGIIERKLDDAKRRIKRSERCLKCCICLSLLVFLLLASLAYLFGMSEPDLTLLQKY